MPTCPGCGVAVGYDELRHHVGTCRFVWSEAPRETDGLSQHLAEQVERLERRLAAGDADESEQSAADHGATRERPREDRERNLLR